MSFTKQQFIDIAERDGKVDIARQLRQLTEAEFQTYLAKLRKKHNR